MPFGYLLERFHQLIGHSLPTYVQFVFCCCVSRRSRAQDSANHSSQESLDIDSRQQKSKEESEFKISITKNKKHIKSNVVNFDSSAGHTDIFSSSDSTVSTMNSMETGSNGHRREASSTYGNARRFTDPYRSSRPSQVSQNTAYRSLSNASQNRRINEITREDVTPRRQTVSPDLSFSSNFEGMNITSKMSNGGISPASSTFTLSSQIVGRDFEFTVARLRFVLDYTFHMSKLSATINKVELTDENMIKDKECMEIDLALLPDKRQNFRIKAKNFTEPHAFYIYPRERLPQMKLRFRLYENQRMLKRVLLAEGVFALNNVRLGFELITLIIELFPPTKGLASRNKDNERSMSPVSLSTETNMRMTQDPELLVSLQHRPSVQRLNIEILKTRCCGHLVHNKPVSMYVEIKLISSSGDLLFDTKTSIRRDSPNPEFNEKFSFFLPENNLLSVTLLVTLLRVSRPFGRKFLVGRFSIGRNNSDKDEEMHWNEVVRGQDCGPILKWHKLFQL